MLRVVVASFAFGQHYALAAQTAALLGLYCRLGNSELPPVVPFLPSGSRRRRDDIRTNLLALVFHMAHVCPVILFILFSSLLLYFWHDISPKDPARPSNTPAATIPPLSADGKAVRKSDGRGPTSNQASRRVEGSSNGPPELSDLQALFTDAVWSRFAPDSPAWPHSLASSRRISFGKILMLDQEASVDICSCPLPGPRIPTSARVVGNHHVDYLSPQGRCIWFHASIMVEVKTESRAHTRLEKRQPVPPLSDQQHLEMARRLVASYEKAFGLVDTALDRKEAEVWQCHEATMQLLCQSLQLALRDMPGRERAQRLRALRTAVTQHEHEYRQLGDAFTAIARLLARVAEDLRDLERWRPRLEPALRSLLEPYRRRCAQHEVCAASDAAACRGHADAMRLSAQELQQNIQHHDHASPIRAALEPGQPTREPPSPTLQKRHAVSKEREQPHVDRRLDESIRNVIVRAGTMTSLVESADRDFLKAKEAAHDFSADAYRSRAVFSARLGKTLRDLSRIERNYQYATEVQISQLLPRCQHAYVYIVHRVELSAALQPLRRFEPLCERAKAYLPHCRKQRQEAVGLRRRLEELRDRVGSAPLLARPMPTKLRRRSLPPHPNQARVQSEDTVAAVHRAMDRIEMRIWMTDTAHARTDESFEQAVRDADQLPWHRPPLSAARYAAGRSRLARRFVALGNEFGISVREADGVVARCVDLRDEITHSGVPARLLGIPRLRALEDRAAASARQRMERARLAAQRIVNPIPSESAALASQVSRVSTPRTARTPRGNGISSPEEGPHHPSLRKRHDEPVSSPRGKPTTHEASIRREERDPDEQPLGEHSIRRLKTVMKMRSKAAHYLMAQLKRLQDEELGVLNRAVYLTKARLRTLPDAAHRLRAQHVRYLHLAMEHQKLRRLGALTLLKDLKVLGALGTWLRHEPGAQPALDQARRALLEQRARVGELMAASGEKQARLERLAQAVWGDIREMHAPEAIAQREKENAHPPKEKASPQEQRTSEPKGRPPIHRAGTRSRRSELLPSSGA